MKKRYVINMKSGERVIISQEKHDKLSVVLAQESCPTFVNVGGNILNTSSISHCVVEDDPTW